MVVELVDMSYLFGHKPLNRQHAKRMLLEGPTTGLWCLGDFS